MASAWPPNPVSDAELKGLELSVDSYYINLENPGDGAIYYLVQHPPPGVADDLKRPYIHRAVWIDGGWSSAVPAIKRFLQRVSALYFFDQKQGGRDVSLLEFPPFDSIVVTHWDKDHFEGLLQLIRFTIRDDVNKLPEDITDEDYQKFLGEYLCCLMKYEPPKLVDAGKGGGGGGLSPPTNKPAAAGSKLRGTRAMTTFYAPYWGNRPLGTAANFYPNHIIPTGTMAVSAYRGPAKIDGTVPAFLGDGQYIDWKVSEQVYVEKICKIRTGLPNILGVNLFTGEKPKYEQALAFATPQKVAQFHRYGDFSDHIELDKAAWPVLAVVAGMSKDGADTDWQNKCCGDTGRTPWAEVEALQKALTEIASTSVLRDVEPEAEQEEEIKAYFKAQAEALKSKIKPKEDKDSIKVEGKKPTDLSVDKNDIKPKDSKMPSVVFHNTKDTPGEPLNATKLASEGQLSQLSSTGLASSHVPSHGDSTTHAMTGVSHKLPAIPVRVVDLPLNRSSDSELANAMSLVSMVIWTSGQISSYHGGDANWESEMRVVVWVQKNNFKSVRTVKLQHHGSADSTPVELIRCFNPRNMIISATGTQTHYHPRWELLLWLHLWFRATSDYRLIIDRDNQPKPKGFVTCTSYPSYLLWKSDGSDYLRHRYSKFSAMDDLGDDNGKEDGTAKAKRKYQASLANLIAKLADPDANYVEVFQAFTPSETKKQRIQMQDWVSKAWPILSEITSDSILAKTEAASISRLVVLGSPSANKVEVIKTVCRPNSQDRRKAADGYLDGYTFAITSAMSDQEVLQRSYAPKPAPAQAPKSEGSNKMDVEITTGSTTPKVPSSVLSGSDAIDEEQKANSGTKRKNTEIYTSGTPVSSGEGVTGGVAAVGPASKEPRKDDPNETPKGTPVLLMRAAISKLSNPSGLVRAAGDPPPPSPPPPFAPTGPFYLVPDFVSKRWKDRGAAVVYKVPSGPEDEDIDFFALFISTLSNPILSVNKNCTLADDDELRRWLLFACQKSAASSEHSVALQLRGTQDKTRVDYMSLSLAASTDHPALKFSTSLLQGNFADRSQKSIKLPPSGFFPSHGFLAFGIAASQEWTLPQVFSHMNVDSKNSSGCGTVLRTVLEVLNAVVDIKLSLNRGMIWFMPKENYLTMQRLEWGLNDDATKKLAGWCQDNMPGKLTIEKPTIISRRSCQRIVAVGNWKTIYEHEMMVMFGLKRNATNPSQSEPVITCGLDLQIANGASTLVATVRVDPSGPDSKDGFLDILQWLVASDEHNSVSFSDVGDMIPLIENIKVRSVELRVATAAKKVDKITVTAEYSNPSWKVPGENGVGEVVVPLLLVYSWTRGRRQPHSISLSIWFEPAVLSWLPPQIMPRYEDLYFMRPSRPAPSRLSLQSLMPGDYELPGQLALDIVDLSIQLDNTTVSFTGALERDPNKKGKNSLGIELDKVELSASYTWDTANGTKKKDKPNKSSYQITLSLQFGINGDPALPVGGDDPPDSNGDNDEADDGEISCAISLISEAGAKRFQLSGAVENVHLSQLTRFFPADDASIVSDLLGHIFIRAFNIDYNYDKSGAASNFSVTAALVLDVLDLDLAFYRDINGWTFDAFLHSEEQDLTVRKVVQSVLGDARSGEISTLPDFVADINLSKAFFKLSLRSHPEVKAKENEPAKLGTFVTGLELSIPGPEETTIELEFLQITTKATGTTKTDVNKATKRLVKVTLGSLPWKKIPKVPVVDKLEPAFDQLAFYWVQDPTWKDPSKVPGLTRDEVEKLREVSPVYYKETAAAKDVAKDAKAAAASVVVQGGMHFLVLDSAGQGSTAAVLDYLFNKPKLPNTVAMRLALPGAKPLGGPSGGPATAMDTTPTGTSKATLEKKVGPFSVSNVGVRFEGGELIIFLDILANLGPIKLALLGFGIGMDLSNKTLKDIVSHVPSFHLQGMGVEFNQPPVGIAGMFVERKTQDMTMYVGGIALTIQPYSFMAVGAYGEVKKDDHSYKTVFFFAKLNGPLIELEFVTIGGICLGFGYNSHVRFPSIQEVPSFPFIANDSLGGDSPLAVMEKLSSADPQTGVVSPAENSYWLAAGLSAKALQVLDVSAVVVLEFNPYVSLGIFARAVGQMPPAPTPRQACFLYVELGIEATVDLRAGALRIEAHLSPNSFVLAPMCHLSGGFALCYWFPPSPFTGDFVFTVGGYHAAFKPPSHYPVPPRLAITWAVSSELMITGEAYFAVTPKACMGGGMLRANFNAGLLHAWLTAHADFLIEYHPFKFLAQVGLRVGVHFTLELLFITIDIGVEIRAELTMWGNPFGGTVYVDFWVFGFTIGFGDDPASQAVDMATFYELLTQIPDAGAASAPGSPAVDRLHVVSVEKGRYGEKARADELERKQGEVWEVKRGGFVFRVQSRVPMQTVGQPGAGADDDPPRSAELRSRAFYAKPMHLQKQLGSETTVTVTKDGDGEVMAFTLVGKVLKDVPLALWGQYDPKKAPGSGNNKIDDLLDPNGGSVQLMMGASFHAPPPHIAKDKLVPFDVLASSSLDVFTEKDGEANGTGDEHPKLPATVTVQAKKWTSQKPAEGSAAAQWETVRGKWQAPELVLPPNESGAVDSVVETTMGLWSAAFGWDISGLGGTGDVGGNQLRNEVKVENGRQPIVWEDFEELYMAAPLVSVAAA